jgi:DNA-binding CsgD family transcriptional regulator
MSASRGHALVGRSREQVFLQEALHSALSGHGQFVIMSGEAGFGKTSLVRGLLESVRSRPIHALTGQCYDLTNTPPYGPWLDLFFDYDDERCGASPPPAFAGGRLQEIIDRSALHGDVRRWLANLSQNRPVVIVLEDLHWADPASIDLLRNIAPRIGDLPVLLIVTYRVDDLTRTTPLYLQLPSILRESNVLRLELRPLTAADLTTLVREQWRLSPSDEERLVAYLDANAGGNPFYATELLRRLEEAGVVQSAGDQHALASLDGVTMPPLLRQVIEQRVARLGDAAMQGLVLASVIGQEIALDLWGTLAGISQEHLLDLIDAATDAHILTAGQTGTHVSFVHALTRSALYESVLPPRRRIWHRQIADALIERGGRDVDAIAYHLAAAGDDRAVDWLIRAGERAQRAYAWLTARARFAEAAALLEDVPGQEENRAWLLYRLARLQRYAGGETALQDFLESERLARSIENNLLAADAWYSRGVYLGFAGDFGNGVPAMVGGISSLEKHLDDRKSADPSRVPWMADSLALRPDRESESSNAGIDLLAERGIHHRRGGLPLFQAASGRLDEAVAIGQEFIEAVERAPAVGSWITSATGHAWFGVGQALAYQGKPGEACEALERGRALYEQLDHHAVIAFSLLAQLRDCVIPCQTDHPHRRQRLADWAEQAMRQAEGAFHPGTPAACAQISVLTLAGAWDDAVAIADLVPERSVIFLRREVTTNLAAIFQARGDRDAAWRQVRVGLPDGQRTDPGATHLGETAQLQRIAAALALDDGRLETAAAWLRAHDRLLDWSGAMLGRADGLLGWARWHQASGEFDHAFQSAGAALEAADRPSQPLARLLAHRALGELATATGEFDLADEHLHDALDLARACEIPWQEAQTRAALAEWHSARRDRAEASRHASLARAIATSLGAAPLLARLDQMCLADAGVASQGGADAPFGLTAREAEVLRLVAQGLTDAEIGQTLFISPRTAGQHLRSIYRKLDVTSRSQATRLALEHGLA